MPIADNLAKCAFLRTIRRERDEDAALLGTKTATFRATHLRGSKNPGLLPKKKVPTSIAQCSRLDEGDFNSLRLNRHPWVWFESGVASCDLCGGQGTVDHLLDACAAWRDACDLEPPTSRVALNDPSKIIPHMAALRLSRVHKARSRPRVGVFTLVGEDSAA